MVKEISEIIMNDARDTTLKTVTITGCEVTNDLSFEQEIKTIETESFKIIEFNPEFKEIIRKRASKEVDDDVDLVFRTKAELLLHLQCHLDGGLTVNLSCFFNNQTTAPDLLATTLAQGGYEAMFQNCSALQSVRIKATPFSLDLDDIMCFYMWLEGAGDSLSQIYCYKEFYDFVKGASKFVDPPLCPDYWSFYDIDTGSQWGQY